MTQAMIFCRTNLDCDNLERFLNKDGGNGKKFSGKLEKGMEGGGNAMIRDRTGEKKIEREREIERESKIERERER